MSAELTLVVIANYLMAGVLCMQYRRTKFVSSAVIAFACASWATLMLIKYST